MISKWFINSHLGTFFNLPLENLQILVWVYSTHISQFTDLDVVCVYKYNTRNYVCTILSPLIAAYLVHSAFQGRIFFLLNFLKNFLKSKSMLGSTNVWRYKNRNYIYKKRKSLALEGFPFYFHSFLAFFDHFLVSEWVIL